MHIPGLMHINFNHTVSTLIHEFVPHLNCLHVNYFNINSYLTLCVYKNAFEELQNKKTISTTLFLVLENADRTAHLECVLL